MSEGLEPRSTEAAAPAEAPAPEVPTPEVSAPAESAVAEPALEQESDELARRAPRERPVAPKEYYSISEVCDLTGLRAHVLRYWETQFPLLSPSKNRSGNRVYQRKEIKLILFVKQLLYEEKYTVEGAKQRLEQLRKGGELQSATKGALDKQMVKLLRLEMRYLAEVLTPPKPS